MKTFAVLPLLLVAATTTRGEGDGRRDTGVRPAVAVVTVGADAAVDAGTADAPDQVRGVEVGTATMPDAPQQVMV